MTGTGKGLAGTRDGTDLYLRDGEEFGWRAPDDTGPEPGAAEGAQLSPHSASSLGAAANQQGFTSACR